MDIVKYVEGFTRGKKRFSIGKSEFGRDIFCVHCGSYGGPQIILTAGIHARECYTALVVTEQIARAAKLVGGGAYMIPLVNPDGAAFFTEGDTSGSKFLTEHANERYEWKANARGVDLNCNFDANFGTGAQNRNYPSAHGYIGEYPLCAKESAFLAAFTHDVKPSFTVSYHCMGGELYWEFFQQGNARVRDETIAEKAARRLRVKKVDGHLDSAGGYKDWCVQSLGIPAVTVELIRSGVHPFEPEAYASDIALNADLPQYLIYLLRSEDYV